VSRPSPTLSTPDRTASGLRAERRAIRSARIIALVLAGATVRDIAAQVGVAKSQAAAIICRELGRRVVARGEDLAHAKVVALEADHLHVALWARALTGDPDALDALLKIHDCRPPLRPPAGRLRGASIRGHPRLRHPRPRPRRARR